jgi:hypothetical protein
MFAAAALLWYVVVAGPQGGVTSLPTPFDQRDQCLAAVKEYEATKPPANWSLQCIPGAPAIGEEDGSDDSAPADEPQQ